MSIRDINDVEREIDEALARNELATVSWTQSAWTILSVAEDHHFKIKVTKPLPEREEAMYVDGLINALTYPLRVLYQRAPKVPTTLDRRLIDTHYGLAQNWLDAAKDYSRFSSIFPLFHANEIELTINGDMLDPTDWSSTDLSYEVYDRFVARRPPERERRLDANAVEATLRWFDRKKLPTRNRSFVRIPDLSHHEGREGHEEHQEISFSSMKRSTR